MNARFIKSFALALLCLLAGGAAFGQVPAPDVAASAPVLQFVTPTCLPKTARTPEAPGSPRLTGTGEGGQWSAWWCPNANGSWSGFSHVALDAYVPSMRTIVTQLDQLLASGDLLGGVQAMLRNGAVQPTLDQLPAFIHLQALADVALAANRPAAVVPPPVTPPTPATGSVMRVAPYSTLSTRPAYLVSAGLRNTSSVSRASVGALCTCAALQVSEGLTTYCSFTAAPASTVTVCAPGAP